MNVTHHAQARIQQRGIPPLIVEWLMEFGAREAHHGADRVFFDKQSKKKLAQRFGHQVVDRMGDLLNMYLVESEGNVVTAGHRTRRVRRT